MNSVAKIRYNIGRLVKNQHKVGSVDCDWGWALGGVEHPKRSLRARGQRPCNVDPPWEGEEGEEEKDQDDCERSSLGER